MTEESPPTVATSERYILNRAAMVAHDARHLSEECNTDQIEHRTVKPAIPAGFRICRHCAQNIIDAGGVLPAAVQEVTDEPSAELPAEGGPDDATATGEPGDHGVPGSPGSPDEPDANGDSDDPGAGASDADAVSDAGPLGDGSDGGAGAGEVPAGVPDAGEPAGPTNRGPKPPAGQLTAWHAEEGPNRQQWSIANSTNLVALEFNPAHATLQVDFVNGGRYVYGGVTLDAIQAIVGAESPGHTFDEVIKKAKYHFEKVKAEA